MAKYSASKKSSKNNRTTIIDGSSHTISAKMVSRKSVNVKIHKLLKLNLCVSLSIFIILSKPLWEDIIYLIRLLDFNTF